ncbi:MAG: flagellin [Acidimicrobiales bacterium]
MGLDIVNNTMAQDANNDLSINQANMQNSLEKLSSGYAINNPADDPSGLVISQHLQSQIGGFQQAQANTQNAINVVQTANGALNEVDTILQRINTLAVEAANTTATDPTALTAAQQEVTQSLASLDDIANSTVYGNQQLLVTAGGQVTFNFQIGANGTTFSQASFAFTSLSVAGLSLSTIGSGATGIGTTFALAAIATAISTVSALQGTLGAYQNELQDVSDNEGVMVQNLQSSNAQIADTNMASEMSTFTQDQVLVQAGVSMLAQANQIPQYVLKLLG